MADDAIKEYSEQVTVLANLHAFRQRPLPKFGKFDNDDRLTNLQRQLDDIHNQIGVISCAFNEMWKIVEPSKAAIR